MPDLLETVIVKPSDTLQFKVKFNYQNNNPRDLEANLDYPSRVNYVLFQHALIIELKATEMVLKNDMIGNSQEYSLLIVAPDRPGKFEFYLSLGTGWLPPSINSKKVMLIVE